MKRSLFALTAVVSLPFAVVACDMLHLGGTQDAAPEAAAPAASSAAPAATPTTPAAVTPAAPHGEPGHEHAEPGRGRGEPHAAGDGGTPAVPPVPGLPTALPNGFPTALPSGLPTALPSNFPHIPIPSGFPSTFPVPSAHQ